MDTSEADASSNIFRLSCTNVPQELLLKTNAKHYFSNFGRIIRMVLKPKSRTCIIEYNTEKSVHLALAHAGEYNGFKFNVTRESSRPVKKKRIKKEEEDPDWTLDPEVQEELKAMGANIIVPKQYNLRPEAMQVEQPSPVKERSKVIKRRDVNTSRALMTRKDRTGKLSIPQLKSGKIKVATKIPRKTQPKSSKVVPMEQMELIKVLKQAALTNEEKYKVLEARDKLIRLNTRKHTDLTKAKVTVGTCPDMCPERERLMRETQHQVALYEQETGGKGMNPFLAVKQYSRSSADQEVPLPHELRPVKVLQMTMSYLMHKIMNLCDTPDVNFGEWYHFLWDRTRGIRKDITQQELCCQGSVQLVEQCARFHIHCSARLVAEDPSVFDQKINTENLTKCLQTLKYMYLDLEVKNIRCPNEAEFRAYIILLNLNDGNFMWEVQQLKPEIQKSPEVKFALQVYSALDKNNFVKFFKLVRSTTYLNACILLRYFTQVRLSAIKTILKCFSPRIPHKSHPLHELSSILAFEDVESAIEFLEYHGLLMSDDRTQVILDRRLFNLPELPYALDRAINVIESKRNCSVGQIVCGEVISTRDFENHVPQNSFDANGFINLSEILKELNLKLSDVLSSSIEEETEQEENLDESQKQRETATVIDSPPKAKVFESGSVFGSKMFSNVQEKERSRSPIIGSQQISENKSLWGAKPSSSSIFGNSPFSSQNVSIFGSVPKINPALETKSAVQIPTLPNTSPGSVFQQKTVANLPDILPIPTVTATPPPQETFLFKMPEMKFDIPKREEQIAVPEKLPQKPSINEELIRKEAELAERRRIEADKAKQLKLDLEKKRKELERQKQILQKKLLEEKKRKLEEQKLRQEIKESVSCVMAKLLAEVEANCKRDKLKEIADSIKRRLAAKYFKLWRENLVAKSRKRKAMDCSPVWITPRTVQEEAKELYTRSQELTLQYMKRYKYGKSIEIKPLEEKHIGKLKLHQLVYPTLLNSISNLEAKFPKEVFWKVSVSLPDPGELPKGLTRIENTLKEFIQWKENNRKTMHIDQQKTNNHQVTYCITKQNGVRNPQLDSHSFIFLAHDFNDTLLKRIHTNISALGQYVSPPISVILEENKGDLSKLEAFAEQGFISSYQIFSGNFTPTNLVDFVKDSLLFLAGNLDEPPPLELDTLYMFLYKYLCSDLWKRVASLAKWNSYYKSCLKDPSIVVRLYNEGLEKLTQIILEKERHEFQEFPEVFSEYLLSNLPGCLPCDYKHFPKFWKDSRYELSLKDALHSLKLTDYKKQWPPRDELQLEKEVHEYSNLNFEDPERAFYKTMSVILHNVDPVKSFDRIKNVSWVDVIETIALEKLNQTDLKIKTPAFAKSIFNQLFVVYNRNSLEEYGKLVWYYIKHPVIERRISELMRMPEEPKANPDPHPAKLDIDLNEMLSKITAEAVENKEKNLKRKKEMEEMKRLMGDLRESILVQKKINCTLQEVLKKAIEDK